MEDGRTARERMRAERDAAARRARLRKRGLITAGVVTAAALATAYFTTRAPEDEAAGKLLIVPANTVGQDRTSVAYGKPDARQTLTVCTALDCPACRKAEEALGPTMRALADQGAYGIEYQVAAAPDGGIGKESRHATNALGAAANADAGKFACYLRLLLAEDTRGISDDGLLKLAQKVEGLRSPAFDKAVRERSYLPWVNKVTAATRPSSAGRPELPAIELNGTRLSLRAANGELLTPEQFTGRVRDLAQD